MNSRQNKPVIILLGPTAVGKTGCSLILAQALDTEIISADSMLVYRHMDIGTAKPSPQEREEVRHHFIDILNPDQAFSAGLFREKALAIIGDLHGRGKIPLVVGGTGLYIASLTRGLFRGPAADEAMRTALAAAQRESGAEYLYEKLKSVDPDAAGKIEPNDSRRIIRALEVYYSESRAMSEMQRHSTAPPEYDFLKIGLTRDRKELYRMIEARVDRMMEEGLLEETEELLKMNPGRTALQALGYKEIKMFLDHEADLDEAVRLIKKRTKMFAKRQYTWFRKEHDVHWVDVTGRAGAHDIFTKMANDVKMLHKFLPVQKRPEEGE
ncbi:MAG: tRNA (adenosine(37)-N6)-dimethylallyltransferase MiaA [Nitrospiraceae bacterium]|nr:MAG: tRNA (adenosine(37)-N6)-dimethylallyltransferase MiaA [Nitrospiraceae bacterium]